MDGRVAARTRQHFASVASSYHLMLPGVFQFNAHFFMFYFFILAAIAPNAIRKQRKKKLYFIHFVFAFALTELIMVSSVLILFADFKWYLLLIY